jgi:hypothetical protein
MVLSELCRLFQVTGYLGTSLLSCRLHYFCVTRHMALSKLCTCKLVQLHGYRGDATGMSLSFLSSSLFLLRGIWSSLNCAGWYSYLGTWAKLHEQIHIVVFILILLRGIWSSLNCAGWYSYLGTWAMLHERVCPSCRLNFVLLRSMYDPLWTVQDGTATYLGT